MQVGRKRKYEDLDFSEDQISRKSVRQMLQKKNADSKNGSANGSPDPTPAASPSPEEVAINEWSWEKALCSDPEALMRQASRHSESEAQSHLALQVNNCLRHRFLTNVEGPSKHLPVYIINKGKYANVWMDLTC